MPFTPFHLGPGAVFKAIGGKHFSFMVFGGAQVLMDIEVLVRMMAGTSLLHGLSHTLLGATIIGLIATLTGKPISELVMKALGVADFQITWIASSSGAFVGTFSHVLLDGFIHADMEPGFPLTTANPLLRIVSVDALQILCVVSGAVGALVIGLGLAKRRSRPRDPE